MEVQGSAGETPRAAPPDDGLLEPKESVQSASHGTRSNIADDLFRVLAHRKQKVVKGRKPVSGPDARVAPIEETAVQRALRTADSRSGQAIFYPHQGTIFHSCEEAKEFYNLYSWEIGFGIRLGRARTNVVEYTTKQDIVCSCEGFDSNENSASARCGCKAMIRLLRSSDHGWYISRVCDEHNHCLSEGYAQKKQWNSHSQIDPTTRDFVKRLRENNVSIGRICNILRVSDPAASVPLRKEKVRSLCAQLSKENMTDDIRRTVKILEDMKKDDPLLEVRFNIGADLRVKSLLWCTGRNRTDYTKFGDAITFDTTYRTNLYSMPFGIFVGVNNHFQSVIFGGVLLTSEKTEDFNWAFSNFVSIMGGAAPCTMLTDQCAAMAKALRTTLPETRHRWCRWHVLKNAKDHLGYVYSKKKKFKREFNELITYEVDVRKFEDRWDQLIKKYHLSKNKFLKRLYRHRKKWAKPYFMHIFCAGMTSTQRSESANHMLKVVIQRAAPMHLFVTKFNELLGERLDQVGKEQHVTRMVRRKLRVGGPLERHAERIYTRAMYERFYDELFEAGNFAIKSRQNNALFVVQDMREDDAEDRREYEVSIAPEGKVSCRCGLFEHMGLICRHGLKVLMHLDTRAIPDGNIITRWCKDNVVSNDGCTFSTLTENEVERKQILLAKITDFVSGDGRLSQSGFIQAMEAIGADLKTADPKPAAPVATITVTEIDKLPAGTQCPPRTLTGGRPPNTGMKSWVAKRERARKKGGCGRIDDVLDGWPEEEKPGNKKMKRISCL